MAVLLTRRAFRVWRRDLESWRRYAFSFFVAAVGDPLFYLLAIGYGLGRFVADIDGVPYAVFLAPGVIAFTAMSSATFETTFGAYTRMAVQHTYAAILATPCSVADVVAGDVLWAASKSALSVVFVLVFAVLGGLVRTWLALVLIPVGFLSGLMFASIAMVVTARAQSYDFFNYYLTFVFSVMVFFAGVFFPLDGLPAWMRTVAWAIPLTHAVRICRAVLRGVFDLAVVGDLLWMMVATAAAFALAERLVRRRLLV